MNTKIQDFDHLFQASAEEIEKGYFQLLSIPSISDDAKHLPALKECARFLVQTLEKIGFTCELWDHSFAPIVFAQSPYIKDAPTLLIYNHYDVQPVDPLDAWYSPPFQPTRKGDVIYARGSQDNKGQLWYVLSALSLYKKKYGTFSCNIKICIEGEEEEGSSTLLYLLEEKKEKVQTDAILVCDLGMKAEDKPAITLGTRGLIGFTVEVLGATYDLHSGSYGGIVYNPLHALTMMCAKLRDEKTGKICIPGFYDNVKDLEKEDEALVDWEFDEISFYNQHKTIPSGGEVEFSPLARAWIRPTIEINGIHGGYGGPGSKTVIPNSAYAKLTCRLVPEQDPKDISQRILKFFQDNTPPGISVTVTIHDGMGKAMRCKSDTKIIKALKAAIQEIYKKEVYYVFEGGSIPVIQKLAETLNAPTAMFGLGLPYDNPHAPNENFSWSRIKKGSEIIFKFIEYFST